MIMRFIGLTISASVSQGSDNCEPARAKIIRTLRKRRVLIISVLLW